MNSIKITLALTDAARTAYATQTGTLLPAESEFSLNLLDFTPEQRAALLAVTGPVTTFDANRTSKVSMSSELTFRVNSVPATPDEWISALQANAAARAKQHAREVAAEVAEVARLMPELEALEALSDKELESSRVIYTRTTVYPETKDYDDRVKALAARTHAAHSVRQARERRERDEANDRRRERAAEQEQAAAALAKQREQDRAAWVTAHGSDYLKKAVGAGYDCQQKYVHERAALEHPDYTVDYHDAAGYRERSCPSEAALDEALRVHGEVVWLKSHPTTEDEDFTPCEAVVIHDYLGKYDLIRTYPE